jgi:lactate dehydrogenase-like 2-hydroxyacid dehydrogenase
LKIVFLDSDSLSGSINVEGDLSHFGTVTAFQNTKDSEIKNRIIDADIVVTNKVVLGSDILRYCTKLKLICVVATGLDNIDVAFATENGILVKNVTKYSTLSVAQHCFSLLLYHYRSLKKNIDYVNTHQWEKNNSFTFQESSIRDLNKKNWGVVGLGDIGLQVATIAKCFGANVQYFSTSGKNSNNDFFRVDLETLMSTSDIISIHCPLNKLTKGLINAQNLVLLRPKATVINLARGAIVKEEDMARVLETADLTYITDVLSAEPINQSHPLYSFVGNEEKLIVTPHVAWASELSQKTLWEAVLGHIRAFCVP